VEVPKQISVVFVYILKDNGFRRAGEFPRHCLVSVPSRRSAVVFRMLRAIFLICDNIPLLYLIAARFFAAIFIGNLSVLQKIACRLLNCIYIFNSTNSPTLYFFIGMMVYLIRNIMTILIYIAKKLKF